MAARDQRTRQFWIGFALVVLVGVFLGLKAHQAISLVVGAGPQAWANSYNRSTSENDLLTQVIDRDSLLQESGSFPRDPFRNPTASKARKNPKPQIQQEPEVSPVLRALLYDNINPSVQLSIGPMTSDWLREGDTYKGWVVEKIEPGLVRLFKDDESVVLYTS